MSMSRHLTPLLQKLSFIVLFIVLLLAPGFTLAANVGFVPSTGLWFSRTTLAPKETIRIYTVVINNDFASLDGTVAFYDNSDVIDTVPVQALPKEGARLLRVFWAPTEGEHAISARFIKAMATDEKGVKQVIDLDTINSMAGAPLSVASGNVTPIVHNDPQKTLDQLMAVGAAASSSSQASVAQLSEVQVVVKKEGEKLALVATKSSPPAPVSSVAQPEKTQVLGEKETASSSDPFAKNREILQKAQAVAGSITTTAHQIESAYDTTKSAVDKGKAVYAQGHQQLSKLAPYVKKFEPYWNRLSNNNEPTRVLIIAGALVVGLWLIKHLIRRRFRYRYERYRR